MTAHDEAVEAAAEALFAAFNYGRHLDAEEFRPDAQVAVAAAAPILLAAERQRIAEAIRAECLHRGHSWDDFGVRRVCWTCDNAARIAEATPKETT